jgi:L-aspartate oxidase
MWHNVSIVRTPTGLTETKEIIETLLQHNIGKLLKLRLLTAKAIVEGALERTESIGVHFITQGVKE